MSEQPEYASLAQTAWENAITCVGWEAPAAPEVRISDQDCGENFVGCAHLEGHQLSSINIEPGGLRPASQVMAHEIAHAWFAGPPGLAEGGAQLLADCILAAEPDWPAISQSTEPPKVGTFDLRTWKNRDDSDATREGDQVAYLLVAQVMTVIPMSELPLVSTSWGGLISELRTRGPEPTYLAGLLLRDPMQVVNTDWRSGRVVESNDTSLEAWRDGADESLDL